MALPGYQLFDRIRAFFRKSDLYRQENLYQDQTDLSRITSGANFLELTKSAGLLDQTNLQINRLERYKDYDMMDEVGEISLALDIYSDEASLIDPERKHSIIVRSGTKRVKQEIENLFYNILLIDREIRPMIRYLCKYGDFPAELVPTKNRDGIASLRFINVYNFTRVQTKYGDLVGFFYQDPNTLQPIFLHPWQVMHLRLVSYDSAYNPYGKSIIDSSRKDFKRLRLMEDAALIYRLCLRGDSRVWTPNGYTPINNIKTGDDVYSYCNNGSVKRTKVTNWKHNGKDKIFRIYSKHREIFANKTHPILVVDPYKRDGIIRHDRIKYVDVQDLKTLQNTTQPYCHRFILPRLHLTEYVRVIKPEIREYAKLGNPVKTKRGLSAIGAKIGIKRRSVELFINGRHWLPLDKAMSLINIIGVDKSELIINSGWIVDTTGHNVREISVPEIFDNDFARLFGFLIGDGFISKRTSKNSSDYVHTVGMVLGDDEYINNKYKSIFEKYVGQVSLQSKDKRRLGAYVVSSKPFYEFMELNGFIPGAANKRIPNWVFMSPPSVQEAFIDGLVDADGHARICNGGVTEGIEIECCNRLLIEDLKELCNRLGWNSGLVRHRNRIGGHVIDNDTGRVMPNTQSWSLYFTKDEAPDSERILGIEEIGEDDIYDISVEANEHNFVVQGVCTHNTRAPEKRVFSIPVGNIPPSQVTHYLTEIARGFKKHKFVDPATGQVNERYNPLIQEDDFFLPKRPGGEGPTIETLPGAANLDQIEDILYFKKKMVAGTKIPFSRVGIGEQTDSDSRSISSSSPEFAKAVQWIQREAVIGLKKVAICHLALKGYPIDEIRDLDLSMTAASAIDELYRIETWKTRAEIIGSLKESGLFPDEWILSRFTDMTTDEIKQMQFDAQNGKEEAEASEMAPPPGGEGATGDLLGALGEAVDEDDKNLILEFNDVARRPLSSRKVVMDESPSVDWYVNSNEIDKLSNSAELVGSGVDAVLAEEAKKEIRSVLMQDDGNQVTREIASNISDNSSTEQQLIIEQK